MTEKPDPFEELEQLFDEFASLGTPLSTDPSIDVVDTDEKILVYVDLPGRDPDDIEVTLEEGRTLNVSAGNRDEELEGRYVTRERVDESVSRSLRLPAAVDEAGTEANYDRGVLVVTLPKLTGDSEGTDIPVN